MSADQLSRAAGVAQKRAEATYRLDEAADAEAALLRAASDNPWLAPHRPHNFGCRLPSGDGDAQPGPCLACLLDDVAAAYLGEEPQP